MQKLHVARAGELEKAIRTAEKAASKASALRQKPTATNLTQVVQFLQKSGRLFQAAHLPDKAADISLQAGDVYLILSQYDRALRSFQEARKLDGDNPAVQCLALSRMARTYATTGQKTDADLYSRQALSQCNVLSDAALQAEGMEARGEALRNAAESAESAKLLSQAQELFGRANDRSGQAQALLMLAYDLYYVDQTKGIELAARALRLWTAIGDDRGIALARTALGMFAAFADQFETAQCNYQRSLPVFHRVGDKDNEAVVLNVMGYANRRAGNLELSLDNYAEARAIFAGVHDQLGVATAITGMGVDLSALQQYGRVLSLYKTKLQLAQHTENKAFQASALADLAGAYELQHHYPQAEAFYKRSLDAFVAIGRDISIGDTLIRLALLQEKQGNDSEALELLEEALSHKQKAKQIEDEARIHYEQANIYRRLNRLQDALAAIGETIRIIESQRLKIAKFDSRAAYFSSVHKYYALYIQILMLLDQQQPGQGYEERAFDASEKSKVRAFLDLLSAAKEDSPCAELLQRQLNPATTQGRNEEVTNGAPAPPVLTLQQIQGEIGDDDTVLEYFLGDQKSYVWLVNSRQLIPYELPKAEKIEKLVHVFHEVITARELRAGERVIQYNERVQRADAAYRGIARKLARALLGPVDLSGAKRILIVPDGALQYVPFSALLSEKDEPFMGRHEVVLQPSVSALSTLRKAAERRAQPTGERAMIVADPVVNRYDPRLTHVHSPGKTRTTARLRSYPMASSAMRMAFRDAQASGRVIRLEGSGMEAQAIQETLGKSKVDTNVGFAASRQSILQGALASYHIVHFATHGFIDARHPEMSGLILSLINERGQLQDGYLRLGDIYQLKISADLVVLSACDSALGKDLESEGTIGLPRGFLYAGSRSVLASLWKVDDDAAVAFMKIFYERIRQGNSPSAALQAAQLEMSRGKQWREPFYWAAFVLQGDYR